MDLRIILLASVLAISATNAKDDCCILEVWNNCVVPCPSSYEVKCIKYSLTLLFPILKYLLTKRFFFIRTLRFSSRMRSHLARK